MEENKQKKKTKRKRINGNGKGGISKLSGKRKCPFMAYVTTGWSPEGKQIKKTIGYFATRREGEIALDKYEKNPYDIDSVNITFTEIYEKWSKVKYEKFPTTVNGYIASFKALPMLHNQKFSQIKTEQLQNAIDNSGKNHSTKRKIKNLLNQLYAYSMQNDIISKDYSQYVDIGKNDIESSRTIFSPEEINKLWSNVGRIEFVDTILILIYSGFRIEELLTLEIANIDLENGTMKSGVKTQASKERITPIHTRILPLIEKKYDVNRKYLIVNHKNEKMKYHNYYRDKFKPIMEQLNMSHTPHDCKHTFATLLSNANANPEALKKLAGHTSIDTTSKHYIHKDTEELRKAVQLIE